MKFLIFVGILLINMIANASWICREASSTQIGNTILSCGIGKSQSQQKSKDLAREAAIEEFERLCGLSISCKNFQVQVNPKRTECVEKNSQFTCYRAIEFNITNQKKKDIIVDVDQVKEKLALKREELQNLQNHLYAIEKLKKVEDQLTTTQKQIEKLTGTTIELSRMVTEEALSNNEYKYTHLVYSHSIRSSIQYSGHKFTQSSENNISFNLNYERRFLKSLGIQLGIGFGGDFSSGLIKSDSEVPNTGVTNSNQNYVGMQSFKEYGVSVIYYTPWWGTYIRGELGTIQYERKLFDVTYGPLGTKTSVNETKNKGNKSFVGGYFGFDSRHDLKGWGFYSEIGIKKVDEEMKPAVVLGLNFGF